MWKPRTVKVKKAHTCELCFRKTEIGNPMYKFASIYEGDFCHGYMCPTCYKIMSIEQWHEWTAGEVSDNLKKGQTPEHYLIELYEKKWNILAQIFT